MCEVNQEAAGPSLWFQLLQEHQRNGYNFISFQVPRFGSYYLLAEVEICLIDLSHSDLSLFLKLKLELGFPSPFDFTIEITQLMSLLHRYIEIAWCISRIQLKWRHWKQSKSPHKHKRQKLLWFNNLICTNMILFKIFQVIYKLIPQDKNYNDTSWMAFTDIYNKIQDLQLFTTIACFMPCQRSGQKQTRRWLCIQGMSEDCLFSFSFIFLCLLFFYSAFGQYF